MKILYGRSNRPSFMTENPHFIPGYTGHCPQLKFRNVGTTFGHISNEILTDPPWKSSKSILNTLYPEEVDLTEEALARHYLKKYPRNDRDPVIYTEDIKTGYAGTIPHSHQFNGKSFTINNLLATSSFHQQQRERKKLLKSVDVKVAVVEGAIPLSSLPKCTETSAMAIRYGTPLQKTYPTSPPYKPRDRRLFSKSPYDMDENDENKFIKSGYSGHVPLIAETCGQTSAKLTNEALKRFRDGRPFYHPVSPELVDTKSDEIKTQFPEIPELPSVEAVTSEKKIKHKIFPLLLGLPNTYKGHVQDLKQIVGMTYGNATLHLRQMGCPIPLRNVDFPETPKQPIICPQTTITLKNEM